MLISDFLVIIRIPLIESMFLDIWGISIRGVLFLCMYHIAFAPKYHRQIIYKQIKSDGGQILGTLCRRKGIEIIETQCYSDYIHVLVRISLKYSVLEIEIMGYLKSMQI